MLNQSEGSAGAAWVVQGRGFAPGTLVAVSLTWDSPPQQGPLATFHRTATLKPVVAANGTLRLNISQVFPGSLKLGRFMVEVTGPDGSGAHTIFIVIPPGA